MCDRQLTLFECDKVCHGCNSAQILADGRHKCLRCGRVFKHYRDGHMNCGVTCNDFYEALIDGGQGLQVAVGEYEVPESGVVIRGE